MEDLLGFILELLFEVLIQLIFEGGIATASRAPRLFRPAPFLRVSLSPINPALTILKFTVLGLGLSGLSVILLPRPFVHPAKFHGMSLLISPVITGFVMGVVGRMVRRRRKTPAQIESFLYGFTFAFAFSLVRFLLVR